MVRKPDWATEDGAVQLYCGDCLEILPELGQVDAVVTDPPYGIGYSHGGGGKGIHSGVATGKHHNFAKEKIINDDNPFDPRPFCKWKCVMFGADHYASRLPQDGVFHVWDKDPKGALEWDSFSDAELVWTNWRTRRRVFRFLWKGLCQYGAGVKRLHSTMKPVEVMVWCLHMVEKSTVILDPFMGSGTTGLACIRLGRKFIGIEKEPKYFKIAVDRIEKELERLTLFEPKPEIIKQTSFIE